MACQVFQLSSNPLVVQFVYLSRGIYIPRCAHIWMTCVAYYVLGIICPACTSKGAEVILSL